MKDRRPRNQNLSPCPNDARNRIDVDSPIDLDCTPQTSAINHLTYLADFVIGITDKFLAPESRVHAHDEDHVYDSERLIQDMHGCRRIDGNPDTNIVRPNKV